MLWSWPKRFLNDVIGVFVAHLRVSNISRRLARLWPDQSGGCSQARGSWVFADPRNEIRKDHDLQGSQSREGPRN
jgi:hypothetical protein